MEFIVNDQQVSSNFHKALTYQWSLTMLLDQQACQLMVVNEESNAVEMLADLQISGTASSVDAILQAFAPAVGKLPLLPIGSWKQVKLVFAASPFTLIPSELFNESHLAQYAQLGGVAKHENPAISQHAALGIEVVFEQESIWTAVANELAVEKKTRHFHSVDGFILQVLRQIQPGNQINLFCHVGSFHVLVAAFQGKKLLLLNRYATQDDNSLLYFIQLVAQETEFSNLNDTLHLAGPIMPGSVGYEKLSRFFSKIQMMSTPNWLEIPAEIASSSLNRYSLIMSNHLFQG